MLDRYVTVTRLVSLDDMIDLAEIDLPLNGGAATSADWLNRLSYIVFQNYWQRNDRRMAWLINMSIELARKLTANGSSFATLAGFENKDRIRYYNSYARRHTLAVSLLVRKHLRNRKLTAEVKAELEKAIKTDDLIKLVKGEKIELTFNTPVSFSENIFHRKITVVYEEVVSYIAYKCGKKPSQAFIYKYFPKAKKKKFTEDECKFLVEKYLTSINA